MRKNQKGSVTPSGKRWKLVPMVPDKQHHKIIPMLPEQQAFDDDYFIDWTDAECDINCDDPQCPYTHPVRRRKGDQK